MPAPTLLGLSGSLRKASFNTQLMHNAAARWADARFVTGDLRLPLYDGDLEEASGIPAEVQTLADQIASADAVIVVTPEYNKGISGVLKNALDWVSRTDGSPWLDKPVAIMSATAGRAGGERAQTMLVSCMMPFRPRLIAGPEVLVGGAFKEFDEAGTLTNERYGKALDDLMARLRSAAGV